jgi:hypothetical protein
LEYVPKPKQKEAAEGMGSMRSGGISGGRINIDSYR